MFCSLMFHRESVSLEEIGQAASSWLTDDDSARWRGSHDLMRLGFAAPWDLRALWVVVFCLAQE